MPPQAANGLVRLLPMAFFALLAAYASFAFDCIAAAIFSHTLGTPKNKVGLHCSNVVLSDPFRAIASAKCTSAPPAPGWSGAVIASMAWAAPNSVAVAMPPIDGAWRSHQRTPEHVQSRNKHQYPWPRYARGKYDTSLVFSSVELACIIAHTSLTLMCVSSTAFRVSRRARRVDERGDI